MKELYLAPFAGSHREVEAWSIRKAHWIGLHHKIRAIIVKVLLFPKAFAIGLVVFLHPFLKPEWIVSCISQLYFTHWPSFVLGGILKGKRGAPTESRPR